MVESVKSQKESEAKKLKLQKRRLKFQLGRTEKKEEPFRLCESVIEREQALETKRFEMDKLEKENKSGKECGEREDIREQRRAMAELMKIVITCMTNTQ